MNQHATICRSSAAAPAPQTPDGLEALLALVQGGELHQRQPLSATPGSPFLPYIEIGCALRTCLRDPAQHGQLAARLWPCADLVIGTLPAGIQPQGLLPELSVAQQQTLGFRALAQVSEQELRDWVLQDCSIIYGELTRAELQNYFDVVVPLLQRDGAFIDLGSGLGKVVMTAALTQPFQRCIGVELLPYRHQMAQQRRAALLAASAQLPSPQMQQLAQRITLLEQDMFAADLSDASLVFLYSTCFGPLMPALAERLAQVLPPQALVSTTTYALRHPAFRLLREFAPNTLAWTAVYLYQRVSGPEAEGPAAAAYRLQPDPQVWQAQLQEALAPYAQPTP